MVQGQLKCCKSSHPSSPRVFQTTEFWLVGCGIQMVLLNSLMSCISCTTDKKNKNKDPKVIIKFTVKKMTKTEINRPGESGITELKKPKTSLIASSQKINEPHWSHQFVARVVDFFGSNMY